MLAGLGAPGGCLSPRAPAPQRPQGVANVFAHILIVKRAKGGSATNGDGGRARPGERERCDPDGGAPDRRRARGARQGGAGRGAALEPRRLRAAAARPDPIELLERQAETRVPELVPIRYGRMLVSPFTFYRGAALIMASDLAATPRSGLHVQCCGDAHLSNFGVFASPERRLVFDINDFDETLPGPWEWDVKRLAVSMLIAARNNELSSQGAGPDRARHRRGVPHRDGGLRRDEEPRGLVRAPGRRKGARRNSARSSSRRRSSGPRRRSPRRAPRTACRRSPSSRTSSTARRGSSPNRR